ncbi:MAG: 30S ribosomal protein S7 [Candidatus Komeilibacteria bacterium CG10_big_fil_rev_8_21_14_0_10_41_13]|uniref:Small ribosomal subunit protein uS7 n=1 Tax=Candidatus Komeilibacteria bacterium CG10_big_fil_rev_8_21_14_0_10_41_13 TaxID=1974476 RepID=A0A2M6WD10_9BACT|nr:MAG: 30S ribosomal protein S7 [Candidatus Komeilibacteria bacterium CG10_big_fil_rev_8_21_14_0_10_41_13]
MRGKQAPKRAIAPDPKFNSIKIAKLINYIMQDGKKSTAQSVVYSCFEIISEKTKNDPMKVFEEALKNVSPTVEVRGRRIGGANYQIPVPVAGGRKLALTYRWIINAARSKKGKPMALKLAEEIMLAAQGEGEAVKKKEETYRMAEANKAFAHFA